MNEFIEVPKEAKDLTDEFKDLSTLDKIECTAESVLQDISDYWDGLKESASEVFDNVSDFAKDMKDTICDVLGIGDSSDQQFESRDTVTEVNDSAREYGLNECADAAKEIFTPEVINAWGIMDIETRNAIAQQYAEAIGKGLGIDYKGIVWEEFPVTDGTYTFGYNKGDGYVHLNVDFLCDPSMLMRLVDTVAHEARHQFQLEAIANPEKFDIDEATINEWAAGQAVYTTELPTAYDPWGYTYNPLEIDAKYFGESMVREITKDIVNS